MKAAGSWVFGGGLHPSDMATVVQVKEGDIVTTDGPYAETKEQLGGFWIIEAADLDAALAWATKAAGAYETAASLATNGPERRFLEGRLEEVRRRP